MTTTTANTRAIRPDPIVQFEQDERQNIRKMLADAQLQQAGLDFMAATLPFNYSYNFSWMGRPVIQFPQDLLAMQEIIWKVQPSLIVETGIAHGGSLVFHASLLELLRGDGIVVGVDIDIRDHNRKEIERHAMFDRIRLIEGSSTDPSVIDRITDLQRQYGKTLVILDSNHTHEHVLQELRLYSPFVQAGSYLVVMDTGIEDVPQHLLGDRPWGKGNNPKTAVWQFLKENGRFEIDKELEAKLLVTSCRDGYLRCIKD